MKMSLKFLFYQETGSNVGKELEAEARSFLGVQIVRTKNQNNPDVTFDSDEKLTTRKKE